GEQVPAGLLHRRELSAQVRLGPGEQRVDAVEYELDAAEPEGDVDGAKLDLKRLGVHRLPDVPLARPGAEDRDHEVGPVRFRREAELCGQTHPERFGYGLNAQAAVRGVTKRASQLAGRRPDLRPVLGDVTVADRAAEFGGPDVHGVKTLENLGLLRLDDGADLGDGGVHG